MTFLGAKTKEDIDTLINRGVDINTQDSFFGQTYLHILVQSESPLLDHFLSKGPNTNIRNKDGKTPIFYAKTVLVVSKLVKNGASIYIRDLGGKSVSQTNPYVIAELINIYYAKAINN